MSRTPLVEPFLLANTHLLHVLLDQLRAGKAPPSEAEIREAVFLGQHAVNAGMPDHVFSHRWLDFMQRQASGPRQFATPALLSLAAQFLQVKGNRAAVKFHLFGDWQNLLSRISGLPVQAALFSSTGWANLHERKNQSDHLRLVKRKIEEMLGETTLTCPFEPPVEDYLQREGLHETHLHLNGTTLAEFCWQRHLLTPREMAHEFAQAYGNPKLRELCHTIDPRLTPASLLENLHLARQLRSVLFGYAIDQQPVWQARDLHMWQGDELIFPAVADWFKASNLYYSHQIEAWWQCLLLLRLTHQPNPAIDRLLHLYLLLQHQHLQLLVQRDDLRGFDQFQKFTFNSLRWQSEADYTARFWQVHGHRHQPSLVKSFEGRFAPKENLQGNLDLVGNILRGYHSYLASSHNLGASTAAERPTERASLREILDKIDTLRQQAAAANKMQLALVVHFIKEPTQPGARHARLRANLRRRLDALSQLLQTEPRLRRWLRGVDAAANELHAAPEVFAPIFRIARRLGIPHATYHAGEDFVHLASGIRQVADALTLLALQPGDRIGHGTALGLHPRHWLQTMPDEITIERGEWMIDLVCAWHALRTRADMQAAANRAASDAIQAATEIFQHEYGIEQLHSILQLRGLWPAFVADALGQERWNWRFQSFDDHWREEAHLIEKAMRIMPERLRTLHRWWCDADVIARSNELVRVKARFFSEAELIALQQTIQQQLVEQGVLIETLPTSNVRISQYQHMRQHHSLRWMGIGSHKVDGDTTLPVSLGSDDPGIFATDLRSEFYHLYAVLKNEEGLSDVQALEAVAKINERGRIYRFHAAQ